MTKQILNVQWTSETKVFICLEHDGKEYTENLEIDGGLDEDEVMIAVLVYMDKSGVKMADDCKLIFNGVIWEAV